MARSRFRSYSSQEFGFLWIGRCSVAVLRDQSRCRSNDRRNSPDISSERGSPRLRSRSRPRRSPSVRRQQGSSLPRRDDDLGRQMDDLLAITVGVKGVILRRVSVVWRLVRRCKRVSEY